MNLNYDEQQQAPHVQRIILEHEGAQERYSALKKFMTSKKFQNLSFKKKHLMKSQVKIMEKYMKVLRKRLDVEVL